VARVLIVGCLVWKIISQSSQSTQRKGKIIRFLGDLSAFARGKPLRFSISGNQCASVAMVWTVKTRSKSDSHELHEWARIDQNPISLRFSISENSWNQCASVAKDFWLQGFQAKAIATNYTNGHEYVKGNTGLILISGSGFKGFTHSSSLITLHCLHNQWPGFWLLDALFERLSRKERRGMAK